jgi:L-iditol 2-dehydrogenase
MRRQRDERLPDIEGAHVAVLGQGPIGLHFSHVANRWAQRASPEWIASTARTSPRCLVLTTRCAQPPRWSASLHDHDRPNVIIEAIGHQVATLRDAVTALAPFGHIFYFGIPDDETYPLPMIEFLRKNARLSAGVTTERGPALRLAAEYFADHLDLAENYVTHVFPVEQVADGFRAALDSEPGRLKVVFGFISKSGAGSAAARRR